MAQTAKRAATYEDLVAASDLLIAEIIFGRSVTHRRGDPRHNWTLNSLLLALAPVVWNEQPAPSVLDVPGRIEVHLGPHIVVPDVAAWRRWRFTPFPEGDWIHFAPDWACEVLSPETDAPRSGRKADGICQGRRPSLVACGSGIEDIGGVRMQKRQMAVARCFS